MAFRMAFHGSQLKLSKPSVLIHQSTPLKGYGTTQYNINNSINKTFFPLKQTTIQNVNTVPTSIDNFVRWSMVERRKRTAALRELKHQKLAKKKELKRAMLMSQEIRDPLVLQAYREIEEEDMGKIITKKKKKFSEDDEDNLLMPDDDMF